VPAADLPPLPPPAAEVRPTSSSAPRPEGRVIVVTAQRGSDQPLRTPIAITRVTGGALEQAHVASILELGQLAPGFQARMGTITASTQLNIRGIGAAANSAIEPSVAVFIDGAYVPRSGASISTFLDLASVEVLRGPQGTLFGRNASAGALSLHSAEPSGGRDARLAVEVGSGERYRVEGMAEAPLAGVVVRIAVVRQWFGGYWHNALDGQRLGGKDETGGRLALKAGSGELSWVFRADYAEARGDGFANLDLDTSSISPAQLSALRTRLGGILPETDLGSTQVNQYVSSDLADRQRGVVNSLSLALGGSRLTLLSSARSWRNRQLDGDIVWTPLPILSRSTAFDSISHGEELQFTSPRRGWLGGRADLVAGLYYFREHLGIGEGFNLGAQFCNIGAAPGALRDSCNAFLAQDPASGADSTLLRFNQVTHSYAGYAQGNFYFTDRLSLTLGGRLTIDRTFAKGLRAGEFRVHYEPIVPLAGDCGIKMEALFRWEHPEHGLLKAAQFSSVFKEEMLSAQVGRFVLDEVIAQLGLWRASGVPISAVTVNATLADFRSPQYVDSILVAISDGRISCKEICVEITEDVLLDDAMRCARHEMERLHQAGVCLIFDDFGTGYASLRHLRDMPICAVKIDRSFINGIATNEVDRGLVESIVGIAHLLGRVVVAEGVETPEQAELLRAMNCDMIQGYLVAGALPAAAAAAVASQIAGRRDAK